MRDIPRLLAVRGESHWNVFPDHRIREIICELSLRIQEDGGTITLRKRTSYIYGRDADKKAGAKD